MAGFVALEVGLKIKFPPPAQDNFEAENHVFDYGGIGVASRKYNIYRNISFFISSIKDLCVYGFYLTLN